MVVLFSPACGRAACCQPLVHGHCSLQLLQVILLWLLELHVSLDMTLHWLLSYIAKTLDTKHSMASGSIGNSGCFAAQASTT